MVHGFGMTGEAFFNQRELSSKFRLIVPDLRGWGKSAVAHGHHKPLSIAQMGDDLFELITHLKLSNIIYIGWSMGAMVFWESAKQHDLGRFAHMIAIDMSPKVLNSDDWQFGMIGSCGLDTPKGKSRAKRAISEMKTNWPASSQRIVRKVFAGGAIKSQQTNLATEAEKLLEIANHNSGTMAAEYWQSLIESDCREIIKSIKLPCSIVQGQKSQLYANDVCVAVCNLMPDCELFCFENAGHALHVEQPKMFNNLVEAIANSINAKTTQETITA
jgi:pimeloyl-ACP methyl ester carboxylesterase